MRAHNSLKTGCLTGQTQVNTNRLTGIRFLCNMPPRRSNVHAEDAAERPVMYHVVGSRAGGANHRRNSDGERDQFFTEVRYATQEDAGFGNPVQSAFAALVIRAKATPKQSTGERGGASAD
jgi:hypothetical protein